MPWGLKGIEVNEYVVDEIEDIEIELWSSTCDFCKGVVERDGGWQPGHHMICFKRHHDYEKVPQLTGPWWMDCSEEYIKELDIRKADKNVAIRNIKIEAQQQLENQLDQLL